MGKSSSLITRVSHWPSENGQIPKKYSFLWFWQHCLFLLQSKAKLSLEIFVSLMVVEMMMVARGATDSGVNATLKAVQLSEASSGKTDPDGSDPAFSGKAGATNGIFRNPGTGNQERGLCNRLSGLMQYHTGRQGRGWEEWEITCSDFITKSKGSESQQVFFFLNMILHVGFKSSGCSERPKKLIFRNKIKKRWTWCYTEQEVELQVRWNSATLSNRKQTGSANVWGC